MPDWSRTHTWIEGRWHEGNPPLIGPRSHAAWLGSTVFDGARVFEGVMPDIDLHAARVNRSAQALGLKPTMQAGEIIDLVREGIELFPSGTALYVKPMYWGESDGPTTIIPDPDGARFCLCLFEQPMPAENAALSITLSQHRRPTPDQAPTDAKAGCLYPNSARALREARAAGFDNAVVLDALGNVAELATANLFMAKDGAVHTPVPNGTFLNGITRQRIIALLRGAGVSVHERSLAYRDFLDADEIFSTGNYAKVMPINRIDGRDLQPGPFAKQARQIYWEFAHG